MGGRSTSEVERIEDGSLAFRGHLSLENNGGFASTRSDVDGLDLAEYAGVQLEVRGDGRTYQFRLRMNGTRIAYKAPFETEPGEWTRLRLAFDAFEPTFRGRRPTDAPPLDPGALRQLGFLLNDGREGDFELEVSGIHAYSDQQPESSPAGS